MRTCICVYAHMYIACLSFPWRLQSNFTAQAKDQATTWEVRSLNPQTGSL